MTAAPETRITRRFAAVKKERRAALVTFVTAGDPDLDTSRQILFGLPAAGADIIELGMPFSDPMADGLTVQRANQYALAAGVRTSTVLDVARAVRAQGIETPLLAMGYFNPILRYGLDAFVAACAEAGIDGLIVPDLPPEESDELAASCRHYGRDLIMLLAPTSTDARIADVARRASGFIYCIALTGITGARAHLQTGLAGYIARVRQHTDLPLAIGFGIANADHVAEVARIADGAVVASALLDRLEEVLDRPVVERAALLETFARELRPAGG